MMNVKGVVAEKVDYQIVRSVKKMHEMGLSVDGLAAHKMRIPRQYSSRVGKAISKLLKILYLDRLNYRTENGVVVDQWSSSTAKAI